MPRDRIAAFLLFSILLLARASSGQDKADRLIRDTQPLAPEEERAALHVPEGFEVQLFASEKELGGKPVNMAFDSRGRLWVSVTREYPYAIKKDRWSDAQGTRTLGSKDTIRILEDSDGDGRVDKVTIFADELNIPTGVLPYKNGCIAWSIPNIWYLEDSRAAKKDRIHKEPEPAPPGPSKADKRSVLFGPLGWERDTHGMISSLRLGLDGWVYATHGFSNTSHFEVLPQNRRQDQAHPQSAIRNPQSLDISSGSVFRFQPDGSAVEIWTHGQVNPFGLCWDSWGNLYSADCHSSPVYQLIRGATYPQFGKTTDPLGLGPKMCDHSHGSTGIAGIIYIDGGVWGPEWDDHLFIGNPVTSKVNHDFITFTGSSPKANERPDFITSDDPWFRPVDLQLGPDGALYVADFYNKIIGHYEVPLDHPGRDRERGRIWRIVRKGFTRKLSECDLNRKELTELYKEWKQEDNTARSRQKWAELSNRGLALPKYDGEFGSHFATNEKQQREPNEEVHFRRVHARIALDYRPDERISRDDYAKNIEKFTLPPFLRYLEETSKEDTHLRQALRIALRHSLAFPGAYEALAKQPRVALLRDELMRISLAVPTTDAANWLLEQLKASAAPGSSRREEALNSPLSASDSSKKSSSLLTSAATNSDLIKSCFTHIARHLPAEREGELVDLVREKFSADLDTQLELFAAIREGQYANRGAIKERDLPSPAPPKSGPSPIPLLGPKTREWAESLAKQLVVVLSKKKEPDWQPLTPPTETNPSPWFHLRRKCADGIERDFLDSHPPGGEKLTGTLRSKTFALPPKLSFWIAGHRGFPKLPPHEKNLIRLIDAESGNELARAYPPRNDIAQKIEWAFPPTENGTRAPEKTFLELTDGDNGSAYAWLAAGGIEPAVVTITDLNSPHQDKHVRAAAELASIWEPFGENGAGLKGMMPAFPDLSKRLSALEHREAFLPETRVALAHICLMRLFYPQEIPELARDSELAATIFLILEDGSKEKIETAKAFKILSSRAQIKLASALATSRETATTLLQFAPPRVLADPLVSAKLNALHDAGISARLQKLTSDLPAQNIAISKLIAARLKAFDPKRADPKNGEQVFLSVCSVCHRIGIRGNLVGPQLDGIGARGPERLLEDILDPNRAVDPAFRLHLVKQKRGDLFTGLLRRDEGGAAIFADAAGQEHRIPRDQIVEDQVSEFSLMPTGFGEALSELQLQDLLAYLLERKP